MRVLSGRLKAVLVAILATIILVGAIVPAATLASDPPGLARFMRAIGKVESGGDYYARNDSSGAYGKYQIMPASWRGWAGRYLHDKNAKPTPANQEIVAAAKFRALYAGLGTWRRSAYWWLTGSSRTTGWSSRATRYVLRVMGYYASTTDAAVAAPKKATPTPKKATPAPKATPIPKKPTPAPAKTAPAATLQHFSEKSPRIAYRGTWKSAGHPRLRRRKSRLRDRGRCDRHVHLHREPDHLVRPGRADPRPGRVSIDGKSPDDGRPASAVGSPPHRAVFTNRWAKAGTHTLSSRSSARPDTRRRDRRVRRRGADADERRPG